MSSAAAGSRTCSSAPRAPRTSGSARWRRRCSGGGSIAPTTSRPDAPAPHRARPGLHAALGPAPLRRARARAAPGLERPPLPRLVPVPPELREEEPRPPGTTTRRGNNPNDNQLASLFVPLGLPGERPRDLRRVGARGPRGLVVDARSASRITRRRSCSGSRRCSAPGDRWVRVHAELTDLQILRPDNVRGNPVYYTHGNDLSYTYQGQLLGAWIGPGADGQLLAVDVFGRGGRFGGYLERVRRNEAVLLDHHRPAAARHLARHGAHRGGSARSSSPGPVDVSWEAGASYRWNRTTSGPSRTSGSGCRFGANRAAIARHGRVLATPDKGREDGPASSAEGTKQ